MQRLKHDEKMVVSGVQRHSLACSSSSGFRHKSTFKINKKCQYLSENMIIGLIETNPLNPLFSVTLAPRGFSCFRSVCAAELDQRNQTSRTKTAQPDQHNQTGAIRPGLVTKIWLHCYGHQFSCTGLVVLVWLCWSGCVGLVALVE